MKIRAKSPYLVVTVLVLAALACDVTALGGTTSTPTPTPLPRSAAVSEISNEVEARLDAEADWAAASEGEQIATGGSVRTGDEARARVDLSDGAIMRLAPNSEFALVTLSPEPADPVTKFTLAAGKLWVAVTQTLGQGSFEIETPQGTATVRGSLMSVSFLSVSGQMIVSCLEGLCRLTGQSGKFTDLQTAQQSEIPGAGQDPTPAQRIDPVQLADWAREFPEAALLAAITTPGPPPTNTPTPTPTPTATFTPSPTPTATPLAGVGRWEGTTSQGWAFTFDVTADGEIVNLLITISTDSGLPCAPGYELARVGVQDNIPIAEDQFTHSDEIVNVSGQFSSSTEASGDFDFTVGGVIRDRDGTSADCTTPIVRSGTWEAAGP